MANVISSPENHNKWRGRFAWQFERCVGATNTLLLNFNIKLSKCVVSRTKLIEIININRILLLSPMRSVEMRSLKFKLGWSRIRKKQIQYSLFRLCWNHQPPLACEPLACRTRGTRLVRARHPRNTGRLKPNGDAHCLRVFLILCCYKNKRASCQVVLLKHFQ